LGHFQQSQSQPSAQIFSGRAVFRQYPSFHTVCLIFALNAQVNMEALPIISLIK
jgi:hypothetical protein